MSIETDKIRQTAMALAKYQAAIDEALYCQADLIKAEHRRDAMRRYLVTLIGEADLMEIMQEEPIV